MPPQGEAEDLVDPRAAFYGAYRPTVSAYVRRHIDDHWIAQDVCQTTWASFFRRWEQYRVVDKPIAMLMTIAQRKVADWYAANRKNRSACPSHDEVFHLADALIHHLGAIPTIEIRIDINHALTYLTRRQREAIYYHYIEDLDIRSVAELMGISADGAKKSVSMAMKALRTLPALTGYESAEESPKEVWRERA